MEPLDALQEALAAEHAAVYVYGVVGGRLSVAAFPDTAALVRSAYDAHRGRRDRLRSLIADRGADPVPAAAAYDVAASGRSADTLTAAAREVEVGCSEVYAQLVSATTGPLRRLAVEALTDTAVRSLELGAEPTAYPGAPELG